MVDKQCPSCTADWALLLSKGPALPFVSTEPYLNNTSPMTKIKIGLNFYKPGPLWDTFT
jgi:hypothetical protein